MNPESSQYKEVLRRIKKTKEVGDKIFYLHELNLQELPPEIGELDHITELNLSHNGLVALPDEIGNLSNLEVLELANNRLVELPKTIGNLSRLKSLNVGAGFASYGTFNNELREIPKEIGQLNKLENLYLSGNKISSLPDEIANLKNLRELNIASNRLVKLPDNIGGLEKLKVLFAHQNFLKEIPSSIRKISTLVEIAVSANKLKTIPLELFELINLERLYLSVNQITHLPKEVGNLINLQKLYISENKIEVIPEEISLLSKLVELDINRNQLRKLPIGLTKLQNLETLLAHKNFLDIPLEILGEDSWESKNAKGILQFLGEANQSSLVQLNEAKVLILGQGGVGKTSVKTRLIENKFDIESKKTQGINIYEWIIKSKKSENIKLNLWDFGGQEIMHSTHQFFLTQRSVYIYVLNSRDEQRANRPEYWLNLIEQYGGADVPIILVINKIDDNPILSLNEASLKRKYNIIGVYRTSCETGEGIDNLRNAIHEAIEELPHVSDNIPSTWAKVKDALEMTRIEKDIIEYTSFVDLCDANGIDQNAHLIILRLFHDLGTVLNFYQKGADDSLEDTKILNPDWVTDGVYAVINSTKVFNEKGVLDKSEIKNILDKKRYPTYQSREFIFGMMKQFELAFPFDSGDRYLIPDLLSADEPVLNGFDDTLNFEYRYQNFMPPSVISRFIVRQHEKIKNREAELWKNGVVIHFEKMQALIRAEIPSNKVTIAVKGSRNRRRELLAIVRDTFDSIHGSFAKLRVQAMVPIPDEEGAAVSYKALLAAEREGRSDIYVEDLDEYIDVRPLLEGVDGVISNRRLFNTLRERFAEEDIRTALFALGIDHENILRQYKGKEAYARETVLHLERTGKIDAFVAEIRKSRPDIDL